MSDAIPTTSQSLAVESSGDTAAVDTGEQPQTNSKPRIDVAVVIDLVRKDIQLTGCKRVEIHLF